jgi:3-hydroxyisobutyrate dehydrogenase
MQVGFVGLGNMGKHMASRLLAARGSLIVYDIDPARMTPLVDAGAQAARSALEVGENADVVFGCLPSCDAARYVAAEVVRGRRTKIYIETATIGRSVVAEIVQLAASYKCDVVDSPISGGARGAEEGTLAVITACPPHVLQEVEPLLAVIAAKAFHVGDTPGLGQVCKLANNAIYFATLLATCEAVVMGVKAGVDAATLVDVINSSTGRNAATLDRFPNSILPRTFNGGAPLGGALKDLGLYLEEANRGHVVTTLVQGVADTWKASLQEIDANSDFTNIIRYFERRAGVEASAIPDKKSQGLPG